MKKRLLSILLMCCMVLTLLPTTAFAEESTETPPVCTCETACAVETMNAECSVCGAEGASAENCAKYIKPADDAAVQPEGKVSDPQPEAALTALIGGSETVTDVSSADELTAAIADSNVITVRLAGDISISSSLTVKRTVTLDLNGHVLKYESANKGSVIVVEGGGQLTIEDSNTSKPSHKFKPNDNGLWVLDEASGAETVTGGVITGGTGYPFPLTSGRVVYYGGGVYIAPGGQLTMTGGNIIGCSAEYGGGVCIDSERNGKPGQFSMSGGSIAGCVASNSGGGVYARVEGSVFNMSGTSAIHDCRCSDSGGGVRAYGTFQMSGHAVIRNCTAESETEYIYGGGVYVNSSSSFVMSGEAKIEDCQAISNSSESSNGGGVYLTNNTTLTLSGNAVIQNCTAANSVNSGEAYGGGVSAICMRQITLAGSASIAGCNAANGSGLYITGSQQSGYGILYAISGSVDGDVVLGDTKDCPCTITGSGGTVFNGKVTVAPGSTIESGTFNGEVINNGTITGGTFNDAVNNTGTITGGTFNGAVNNTGTITGGTFNGGITGTPALITGSGTESDPYQIGTAEQLKRFRDIVNGSNGQTQNRGACAVLTNDVVLNDGTFDANGYYTPTTGLIGTNPEEWTPIGKYTNDSNKTPYTGTFDGKHYAIKGLYVVNLPDVAVGLFGGLKGAAVRNLTVDGYVQGCDFVSGIAGDASANSTIENCRNDCHVVSEYGADSGSFLYVGGIVGSAADTTIAGCVNTGVVEARGSNNVGSVAAGIVGILYGNATVINCYNTGEINVTGDKLREGTAGGIAGKDLSAHNTVSDCYNVGAVTVEYTGNSDSYIAMVGGIMGKIYYSDTTVSNCYSVGTLKSTTGKGTSYIGGVVGITKGTVANCYYLDSTAEKAVWPDGGTVDEATGSKTAAQLGNGTVLALLINGRADSEHPWNSQCQYLAAAGKTLPVFKTQTGDKHTHDWSAWTSNGDGTHSRRCTCNAVETQNCSGGKATCKDKAVCEICKESYGSLDPNNHTDLKHIDAKAATAAAEGNIEYWYCEACGKYFSDNAATKEITQAETVIPKRQSSGSNYSYYTIKATAGTGGAISPSGNVSVRGGKDQTFTITPDQGYTVSDVKIDGKSIGAVKSYTFENVRRTHTIEVIFMKANGNPQTGVFVDVATGSYYEDAVDWAVENGITNGVSSNMFAPDDPCTRAQIVTFLWRAAGSPAPKSMSSFTDVPADAFYAKAVAWAVENGITSGTGEGKFSPNAICTRAQSVTFLYRASDSPAVSGSAEFSDVSTTAFYADAVAWAAKKGITTGIGGGLFGSDNDCTRSQIVTFLWRCKK